MAETPAAEPTAEGEILGPWLRELREGAGMSQVDAAAATGTEVRSIRRWENAGDAPSGPVLLRLLSAYGVAIEPAPPAALPRAVNAEVQRLRDDVVHGLADLRTIIREELERAAGSPAIRAALRDALAEPARGDTGGRRRG